MFNSPAGVEITFQVMAVARQSTCHHNAVSAAFEGAQHLEGIQPAGARHHDNFDLHGILHAQSTGQVGGGVRAVLTAKGDNLDFT